MLPTSAYGDLSCYASGSTNTCYMENFYWILLLDRSQGICNRCEQKREDSKGFRKVK